MFVWASVWICVCISPQTRPGKGVVCDPIHVAPWQDEWEAYCSKVELGASLVDRWNYQQATPTRVLLVLNAQFASPTVIIYSMLFIPNDPHIRSCYYTYISFTISDNDET